MDIESIIAELEGQRDRLNEAISALGGKQGQSPRGRRTGRRHLTAAERKRISDAMKKRWAARKKAGA